MNDLRKTAIHEAGHAIVAQAMDLPVADRQVLTEARSDGTVGFVRIGGPFHEAMKEAVAGQREKEAWPYLVTVVAGGVADSIASERPVDFDQDRYAGDVRILTEIGPFFATPDSDGVIHLDGVVGHAVEEAREILEERWAEVEALASELREAAGEDGS